MTRQDLSESIAEKRKSSHMTMVEICSEAKMLPRDITRIEKALHNYNLQKFFQYLAALNCQMRIHCESQTFVMLSYDNLADFIVAQRTLFGTQRAFAEKVGVGNGVLANIERKRTIMSIDTFAKIANTLNWTVNIEFNE